MARRRDQHLLDDIFELLKVMPAWVGPVLALIVFGVIRWGPAFLMKVGGLDEKTWGGLGSLWDMFSWLIAGAVMMAWVMAEVWKFFNRRLLDGQKNLESIRGISWREFERLVSEAYRRKGYLAEVVDMPGGDGGVDIRLRGNGERVIVQCKQWLVYAVDVKVVRELLGVVVKEEVDRGIVVTSGRFTQEAIRFARGDGRIELVDGPALAELIEGVRAGGSKERAG